MADLADLTSWRDALEAARFLGVRSVEYDGKSVTYRTDAEMAAAIASLNRRIAALAGKPRSRLVHFNTSKGV